MTRSSGQFVTDRIMWRECTGTATHTFLTGTPHEFTRSWPCTYAGETDVTVDPEVMAASWACGACGTEHDVDWAEIVGGDAA